MSRTVNLLESVEVLYQIEQPPDRWLRGVLEALSKTWDVGVEVGGILYDISQSSLLRVDHIDATDAAPGWREAVMAVHCDTRLIPAIIDSYRTNLLISEHHIAQYSLIPHDILRKYCEFHKSKAGMVVNGADSRGKGCALYLFVPRTPAPSTQQRHLLYRLATHLATAYRLVRRLNGAAQPATNDSIESAVVSDGVSAQSVGKNARFQRGPERVEGSTKQGRHVEWKGLLADRWSLVDEYEHEGRRHVVAREKTPDPTGGPQLSRREHEVAVLVALGRSNKLIAHELGLAHSTVRVLVARACAKLAATSRHELIARMFPDYSP